ncbi:fatty acid desaturase [Roseobacteraceae bacterium NS-SX3]
MSEPLAQRSAAAPRPRGPEWPTLLLILACYALWLAAIWRLPAAGLGWAIAAVALLAALHSSLTHEALHGHPFRSRALNEALMFFPLALAIPYGRFRDTHLAHHRDESLTDPYDDPESNYFDPAAWSRLPGWHKRLLRFNNTLLGRMLAGPMIGQAAFMASDWRAARAGDRAVIRGWALHIPGAAAVLWAVALSPMPFWAYALGAYGSLSLLKIRTFLEHRAHDEVNARTVIVEDRGPLAFLFLNNNLHIVHHMHPGVAWYDLPRLYRQHREAYRKQNGAYVYRSYAGIFRHHFLRAKDPVPHPLWQQGE